MFNAAAQNIFEIWNWDDLAYVGRLAAGTSGDGKNLASYDEYKVMQNIGVPGVSSSYENAFNNPACPHAGTMQAYGWYGYEGFGVGVAGFINNIDNNAAMEALYATYTTGTRQNAFGWHGTDGWIPIGALRSPSPIEEQWTAEFNGNDKIITGLWINRISDLGLFGVVGANGKIYNLTLNAIAGKGIRGTSRIGSFAGNVSGAGAELYNLTNNVSVIGNVAAGIIGEIGGIVGQMTAGTLGIVNGAISNSGTVSYSGTSTSDRSFGGIVGFVNGADVNIAAGSTLKNTAAISGRGYVGGIVGHMQNAAAVIFYGDGTSTPDGGIAYNAAVHVKIENTGTVTGTNTGTGGVFGYLTAANVTIANYHNPVAAVITGVNAVGGIIGNCQNGTLGVFGGVISNAGAIKRGISPQSNFGGIVGSFGPNGNIIAGTTLKNSAPIEGNGAVGGIFGTSNANNILSIVFCGVGESAATGGITYNAAVHVGVENTGTVSGTATSVGGLFGASIGNFTIASYHNHVKITGGGDLGGVIGQFANGTLGVSGGVISNEGEIEWNGVGYGRFGGIVGWIYGNTNIAAGSTLKNTAAINGDNIVGGIVGYIANVVANAVFYGDETSFAAGGVAYNQAVHTKVENTGVVTG
jgi:hypothetical protein